ncbi:hypothetical protein BT69DRAFT_1353353 [Atractiella rhizophila]|nr:hypothetical protein BT69DRAFT_1353353 [Atractiella rhizophila]
MSQSTRGDDVYEDDGTTSALQKRVAELTGKEDALFLVSGTMSNQVALRTWLNQPPHSVLLDSRAHVYVNEAGGLAAISQAQATPLIPSNLHHLTWDDDIAPALIHGTNIHTCPTRVISLENTLNGMVFPQDEIVRIRKELDAINDERKRKESDECQIVLHCDGARIIEVAAKTGKSLKELCEPFDSVSICFSKGLGAPIGSVLVGPKRFITRARWFRKMVGGGIRQCGPLTALLSNSLDEVVPHLPRVHALAHSLASRLFELGVTLLLPVETNMVFIDTSPLGFSVFDLQNRAKELKRPVILRGGRVVLHWQISDEAVADVVALVKTMKAEKLEGHASNGVNGVNGVDGPTEKEVKNRRFLDGDWTAMADNQKQKKELPHVEKATIKDLKKDPYTSV